MRRYSTMLLVSLLAGSALGAVAAHAENGPEPVIPVQVQSSPDKDAFENPPSDARPRVWWHWMNGNITKEGIAKDLQWMSDVGIGGFQNFDASLFTPQVVKKRLVYMEPDWQDAFRFAAKEADRHGLEMAIAASPGWSATGGPWVTPADGMKKVTWSETRLAGGKRLTGLLAKAPETTGPYQNIAFAEALPSADGTSAASPKASGDIAVLAIPVTKKPLPAPRFTAGNGAELDAAALGDADFASSVELPVAADKSALINISYPRDVEVRSVRLFISGIKSQLAGTPIKVALEAEGRDGWKHVKNIKLNGSATTQSFPKVKARAFRLVISDSGDKGNVELLNPAPGAVVVNFFDPGPLKSIKVADLQLFPEARIDDAEEKAAYETVLDYHAIASADAKTKGIVSAKVIDLTGRIGADGSLDWVAPKGSDWRILRFGWSLTGKTNHPATPEATGLEVDKLDAAAVRRYLTTYLAKYRATLGDELIGKKGLRALLTDSIEVGNANWTPAMEIEFAARRGYALRPWLPAITGVILRSSAETEKFLYDYRQTLAELLADKHYATIAAVAHENGLTVYGEALEDKRPLLGDDLAMRSHADIPMAALWTWQKNASVRTTLLGDMKGAASVAHVYGKRFVAAESLTAANAPWDFAPADLKPFIDLEFANGINRPVIHTSVHQPLDDMQPGLSLAIFGQYFNRHDSWAPLARPWVDYIARTSYLLQQGRNVADVAWFIGEDSPVSALFAEKIPTGLPSSHAYDFINADMLENALKLDGGEIVATGGARYKAIYLGGTSDKMTLPTLRRISALVQGGATLIGPKPSATPSLADDAKEFTRIADALWGGNTGRGKVIPTADLDAALESIKLAPGVRIEGKSSAGKIAFVEREFEGGRLFFLSNSGGSDESFTAHMRVAGKKPELWDAQTGAVSPVSYRIERGETLVDLKMAKNDALFLLFKEDGAAQAETVKPAVPAQAGEVTGPWSVAFQKDRGAPVSVKMDRLAGFETSADTGIRYFSGIATYTNSFSVPASWKPGQSLWIDLGDAHDVAEVVINGKAVATLWRAPWRVDIGAMVKPGTNSLEIRVANKWVNRLIGDAQPGANPVGKIAAPGYLPDAPLRASGLLGPVTLWTAKP